MGVNKIDEAKETTVTATYKHSFCLDLVCVHFLENGMDEFESKRLGGWWVMVGSDWIGVWAVDIAAMDIAVVVIEAQVDGHATTLTPGNVGFFLSF